MDNKEKIIQPERTIVPEIKFDREKAVLLMNINSNMVDREAKRSSAKERGLIDKEEFHMTIIGSKTGKKILELIAGLSEEDRNARLEEIEKLARSYSWHFSLKPNHKYIKKEYNDPDPDNPETNILETRQSIIQMAELTDPEELENFYIQLNSMFASDFQLPLLHITLSTNSTRADKRSRGIGIYSAQQLEDLHPQAI